MSVCNNVHIYISGTIVPSTVIQNQVFRYFCVVEIAVTMRTLCLVTAGMVGLALSYALSVTSRLSGVITSFTETEKQMVAVERQSYYIANVPQVGPSCVYFSK